MTPKGNIHMALSSIGAAKWRSFLTMFGVIIGVASVITIVSLGEGVKQQLTNQNEHIGSNLITVRGGHVVSRDSKGHITKVNLLNAFAGVTLTNEDIKTINDVPHLQMVVPFATVSGTPTTDNGKTDDSIAVVATTEHAADALNQKVLYGGFFEKQDKDRAVAVIGKRVAENLFGENVPIGQSFKLRGQDFVVQGVFEGFDANPLNLGVDYNNTIFIPFDYAKQMTNSAPLPYQILVRSDDTVSPSAASTSIVDALEKSHGGQQDFTVLLGKDNMAVASTLIRLLTTFVSAIAGISLLVGGIGIMNIMLVAVSERTHEIGIRKSVGATNYQILSQFMVEAIILSATGGVVGIIVSLIANYLLRITTDMQPVITLPIMGLSLLVAVLVGVIFGIAPALKAARKDPIDALRRI
ncbi:MAG: ABC transporter permease [Candidatus Saccharimonadales bacterium]